MRGRGVFPGSIYDLGVEATQTHALELLKEAGKGERLAVAMSTENIVSNENLRMLTAVLENAELPLNKNIINSIEQSVGQ